MNLGETCRFRLPLARGPVRSLCWEGDELVDYAGGGARFRLDGSVANATINWAYRFDGAVRSRDGSYRVIYEKLGTKGLVLRGNRCIREINRSFCHAHVYEYPVAIVDLPDSVVGLTWDHFAHLRPPLERHGPPACLYTDGLALFGHRSPADRLDTHSQFQRAFTALGTAHRVAPDAQAKGKIERRFDTFQKRLVTLLAYEKISDYKNANTLLQTQIGWHNQHQVCRTTGLTPNAAWDLALKEKRSQLRPVPAVPLLDLHLALYVQRRLNADYTLDFLGRTWPHHAHRQKDRHPRPPPRPALLGHSSHPGPASPCLARYPWLLHPLNPTPKSTF
jgi:hypothetical protein